MNFKFIKNKIFKKTEKKNLKKNQPMIVKRSSDKKKIWFRLKIKQKKSEQRITKVYLFL